MQFKSAAALAAMLASAMGSPTGNPAVVTARSEVASGVYDFTSTLNWAPADAYKWVIAYSATKTGALYAGADGEPSFRVVCQGPNMPNGPQLAESILTGAKPSLGACTAVANDKLNAGRDGIHVYAVNVPAATAVPYNLVVPGLGRSLTLNPGVGFVHAYTTPGCSDTFVKFALATTTSAGGTYTATANEFSVGANAVISDLGIVGGLRLGPLNVGKTVTSVLHAFKTNIAAAVPAAITATVEGVPACTA